MHIAVCLDVAADRKQLERLLGRSADRRLAADPTTPYYVQSYGNKEALLARPFLYDLFFIDVQHDEMDSIALIRALRELGVTAAIAYCPAAVDLSDRLEESDNTLILRQPIVPEELEGILDAALSASAEISPKLDIRSVMETVLVDEDEFLYAEKAGDMLAVYLADGRKLMCSEHIENFKIRCEKFHNIFYLPSDLVAHRQAIASSGFGSVILNDGKKFRASHKWIKYMNAVIEADAGAE